jgi:transposase-like protein
MPRRYPPEIRRQVIELHRLSGKSLRQVADDLGVSDMTLRNWIKQAEIDKGEREGLTKRCSLKVGGCARFWPSGARGADSARR